MAVDENLELLKKLLPNLDQKAIAAFCRELKPKPENCYKGVKHPERKDGEVIQYTTVVKKYTCLVCGTTYERTFKLKGGEVTYTLDKTGNNHTHKVSGRYETITLSTTCTRCEYCKDVVKTWSREDLEKCFLQLVERLPFKEKINFATPRKEEIKL